jgi:hypothetical protein
MRKFVFSVLPVAAFVLALGAVSAGAQELVPTDSEQGLTAPPQESRSHEFTDVPDSSPFHTFVSWLVGRGFTGGCAPNLFCPNEPVTRGQLSVFLKVNSVTGSPLGFGFIEANGTKASGSANVTSAWDAGNSRYVITIANHSYFFNLYTTTITLVTCTACTVTTDSVGGNLLVSVRNAGNTANVQSRFQFATFYNGI